MNTVHRHLRKLQRVRTEPAPVVVPSIVAIGAVAATWVLLRLVFFDGFANSDDYSHIRYATSWDRPPETHLETRFLFNWLLRVSIQLLGNQPLAWALPGLLSSLALTTASCVAAWRLRGAPGALAAGLLVASLPGDVMLCTIAGAVPLSVAFMACSAALLVEGANGRSQFAGIVCSLLGGVAGGLAAVAHQIAIFWVLSLAFAAFIFLSKPKAIGFGLTSLLVFFAVDFALNAWITGDALHGLRVLSRWHDPDNTYTVFSAGWLLYPVHTFLASKDFGVLPLVSVMTLVAPTGVHRRLVRCLLLWCLVVWLWFGYGTAKPTMYVPFWRLTRFDLGLAFGLALLAAFVLTSAPRFYFSGLASLTGLHLLLLLASGSWSQSDQITRQAMDYMGRHPDQVFYVNSLTMQEVIALNRLRQPANILLVDPCRLPNPETCHGYYFDNPLNKTFRPPPPLGFRLGQVVFSTGARPRTLIGFVPPSYLERWPFLIRRPSGRIYSILPGPPSPRPDLR
jgi:hypothetical protein